jgi:hypothetical protein
MGGIPAKLGERGSGPLVTAKRDPFGGIVLHTVFGMTFLLDDATAIAAVKAIMPLFPETFAGGGEHDGA